MSFYRVTYVPTEHIGASVDLINLLHTFVNLMRSLAIGILPLLHFTSRPIKNAQVTAKQQRATYT